MEKQELLEFAELICGCKPYVELDGSVTSLFTLQLRVFHTDPKASRAPQDLPMVCFRPEQAAELPGALHAALMRWLPVEMAKHGKESEWDSSSPLPSGKH